MALGAHPRPPKGQGYPRGPVTSASRGEEGRGTLEEAGRGVWESSPVTKTEAPKVEIHTFCPTFSALTCEPALALGQCHWAPSQDVLAFSTRTRTSPCSARRAGMSGIVPIDLYLQKRVASRIWHGGCTLPIPRWHKQEEPRAGTPPAWSPSPRPAPAVAVPPEGGPPARPTAPSRDRPDPGLASGGGSSGAV